MAVPATASWPPAAAIDSTTRPATAFRTNVPYNFSIGDPDLVGGFDRLKIQVCLTGGFACSHPSTPIGTGQPNIWSGPSVASQ
jgi:hypothetical protein